MLGSGPELHFVFRMKFGESSAPEAVGKALPLRIQGAETLGTALGGHSPLLSLGQGLGWPLWSLPRAVGGLVLWEFG